MAGAVQLLTRPVDEGGGSSHPQGAALAVKDHVVNGCLFCQQELTCAVGQLCPECQEGRVSNKLNCCGITMRHLASATYLSCCANRPTLLLHKSALCAADLVVIFGHLWVAKTKHVNDVTATLL